MSDQQSQAGLTHDTPTLGQDPAQVDAEGQGFLAELQRAQERVVALSRTAAEVQTLLDPDRVLEAIGQELRSQGLSCFFGLLDESGQRVVLRHTNIGPEILETICELTGATSDGFGFAVDASPSLQAIIQEGQTSFESDVPARIRELLPSPQRGPALQVADLLQARQAIAAPLRVGAHISGLLLVWSHHLTETDLPVMSLLAQQAAVAMERADLYDEAMQRVFEMEALRATTLDMTRQLDLPQLLHLIVERAAALLGTNGGALYLYRPEQDDLEMVVSLNLGEDYAGTRLRAGQGLSGRVLLTGEPLAVEDYTHWEGRSSKFVAGLFGGVLAVPLKWSHTTIGVLNVTDGSRPRLFEDRDIWLLEWFANTAAVAIENAGAFAERERKIAQLAALHEVSLEILAETHPSRLLKTIVQRATELLNADAGAIDLFNSESQTLDMAISHGYQRDYTGIHLAPQEGVAGMVCQTRQPLAVDDYPNWPGRVPQIPEDEISSALGVPLLRGEQLLGVLTIDRRQPLPFDDDDLQLATLFANQAAVAIHNAQLYQAVQRELAQRKRAEEEYRAVVDHSLQGLLIIQEGRIVFANRALTEMTGYTVEQLLSLSPEQVRDVVHPEDQELVWGRMRDRLAGKEVPSHYEYRGIGRDGKTMWAEMFASNVVYRGLPAVQAAIVDITERKWAEEALRESEERYRSLFEDSRDAVFITTRDGHFVSVNESFLSLFGVAREELPGFRATDFYARPDDRSGFQLEIEDKGSVRDYEAKLRKKDGTPMHTLLSATVWRGPDGATLGYRGIIRDVTERKRAQEDLERSYLTLRNTLEGTVNALAALAEARDPYTAGHQQRVAALACAIGGELGLSGDLLQAIRMAGLVHDIGKIRVPAEILSKPSQLTDIEMQLIRTHPQTAYEILSTIEFPWAVGDIVLQHHERLNGSGYPLGLTDEQILLEAKILAVADVVEAMASNRPYRPAHAMDKALAEISDNAGILYDPQVAQACLTLFRDKGHDLTQPVA